MVKVPEEAWAAAWEEAWAVAWEVPAEEWAAAWEEVPWWGMKHDRIGCRCQHPKKAEIVNAEERRNPAQPAGPTRWVGCEVREVEDG